MHVSYDMLCLAELASPPDLSRLCMPVLNACLSTGWRTYKPGCRRYVASTNLVHTRGSAMPVGPITGLIHVAQSAEQLIPDADILSVLCVVHLMHGDQINKSKVMQVWSEEHEDKSSN